LPIVHGLYLNYQQKIHFKDNEIKGMKDSKKMFKGFGFIGLALCAVCCALSFSGIALWVGSFAVFSKYFESAAIVILILTLIFFGIVYFRKEKTAPACDIDCKNKTHKDSMNHDKVIL